jgi:hypothetical protein
MLEQIKDPQIFIPILAVILALVFVYFLLGRNKVEKVLLALMLQAKRYAKDRILASGQDQEDWVVARATEYIPGKYLFLLDQIALFRGHTREELIRLIVQKLFNALKDYADDGKFNDSNK